jgi:RNA polymerase sigma-70 factor (ECF subfamily)
MDQMEPLERLLAATAHGDAAAFARLYACCAAPLYGMLLRLLGRREWAEHTLLQTFLRVWRQTDRYAPERGPPLQWLQALARYQALETLRAVRGRTGAAGAPGVLPEEPRPQFAVAAPIESLPEPLRGISAQSRGALMLALRDGYTHTELANAQRRSPAQVRRELRAALARLRATFAAAD